jgi:hypothetical protein
MMHLVTAVACDVALAHGPHASLGVPHALAVGDRSVGSHSVTAVEQACGADDGVGDSALARGSRAIACAIGLTRDSCGSVFLLARGSAFRIDCSVLVARTGTPHSPQKGWFSRLTSPFMHTGRPLTGAAPAPQKMLQSALG